MLSPQQQRRAPLPPAQQAKRHSRLLFGLNDVRLNEPGAQAAAAKLGVDQYGFGLTWKPGQQVTGQEFGSIPADKPMYVVVNGAAGSAPQTQRGRKEYANYVRNLVKAHPNIKEVQVWNEPNLGYNWPGARKNYQKYNALLATTYDKMRGTGVKIAGPGSYPDANVQDKYVRSVQQYYKGTGRKRPLFDIYSTHSYWDWQKTNAVAKVMDRLWKGTAQASPKRGLKFWWSESGLSAPDTQDHPSEYTGKATPGWDFTPAQQAQRIGKLVQFANKNPLIGAVFNFLLYDEQDQSRWQSGLLTPGGEEKPAYTALQAAMAAARKT